MKLNNLSSLLIFLAPTVFLSGCTEVGASKIIPKIAVFKTTNSICFTGNNFSTAFTQLLSYNANFLLNHPDASVTLVGYSNETGSLEYNFSLGRQKALVIKNAFLIYGIRPEQVFVSAAVGKQQVKIFYTKGSLPDGYRVEAQTPFIYPEDRVYSCN